ENDSPWIQMRAVSLAEVDGPPVDDVPRGWLAVGPGQHEAAGILGARLDAAAVSHPARGDAHRLAVLERLEQRDPLVARVDPRVGAGPLEGRVRRQRARHAAGRADVARGPGRGGLIEEGEERRPVDAVDARGGGAVPPLARAPAHL